MSLQSSRPGCSSRGYLPSRMGLIAFVILIAVTLMYSIEMKLFPSSVTGQVLDKGATVYDADSPGISIDTYDNNIAPIRYRGDKSYC